MGGGVQGASPKLLQVLSQHDVLVLKVYIDKCIIVSTNDAFKIIVNTFDAW